MDFSRYSVCFEWPNKQFRLTSVVAYIFQAILVIPFSLGWADCQIFVKNLLILSGT